MLCFCGVCNGKFCKIEMSGKLWGSFAFGTLFAFLISISTRRFIENAAKEKMEKFGSPSPISFPKGCLASGIIVNGTKETN